MLNTFEEIRSKYNRAACLSLGVILRDAYQFADYAAIFMPAHYQDTKYKKIADKIQAAFSKNGVVYYSAIAADTTLSNCGLDEIDFEIGSTQNQDIGIAEALTVFHEAHARYVEMWIAEKQAENVVKMDSADDMRAWAEIERQKRGVYFDMIVQADGPGIEEITNNKLNGIEVSYRCQVPWETSRRQNLVKFFKPTQFIIIAGRPHMGKTLCGAGMILHLNGLGVKGALFSLEMGRADVLLMLTALHFGIEPDGDWTVLSSDMKAQIKAYVKQADSMPCQIIDTMMSLVQICAKARQLVAQGAEYIMIDYLQLINHSLPGQNREQVVAHISRTLKLLAMSLHVPVIAFSQLKRGDGNGKIPTMSDLRESGALEQDPDIIGLLHRPAYYLQKDDPDYIELENEAIIIWEKHRLGRTGIVRLNCTRERGFHDKETQWKSFQSEPKPGASAPQPDNSAAIMNANRRPNDEDIPF